MATIGGRPGITVTPHCQRMCDGRRRDCKTTPSTGTARNNRHRDPEPDIAGSRTTPAASQGRHRNDAVTVARTDVVDDRCGRMTTPSPTPLRSSATCRWVITQTFWTTADFDEGPETDTCRTTGYGHGYRLAGHKTLSELTVSHRRTNWYRPPPRQRCNG